MSYELKTILEFETMDPNTLYQPGHRFQISEPDGYTTGAVEVVETISVNEHGLVRVLVKDVEKSPGLILTVREDYVWARWDRSESEKEEGEG